MSEHDSRWILTWEGYDPGKEGVREALCALGNGQFVTRGAAEEVSADGTHYPGTYVASGYNRATSQVAGHDIENEDLVNFPNWLCLTFRPEGGEWVDFAKMDVLSYRRELNMREGTLVRSYTVRDAEGRTTSVMSRRFVHMYSPHLAAIEYAITPEDWSGKITIRSMVDGNVTNTGVARYSELVSKHHDIVKTGEVEPEGIYVLVKTTQSRLEVGVAARTRISPTDSSAEVSVKTMVNDVDTCQEFTTLASQGSPIVVEKVAALYTSRDDGITESSHDAGLAVTRSPGFEDLLRTHRAAWISLWDRADVDIECAPNPDDEGPDEGVLMRLQIFHSLQSVSENTRNLDASAPARGLHGEAYRGHIFWDELYIFPFYIKTFPEIGEAMTRYRYHRLDAARDYAKEFGFRGAMYPWQSSSNGREETQFLHLNPKDGTWGPDNSRRQRHVNVAIVYNIWQQYVMTGSRTFLERYGAEVILEIVRYWVSAAFLNEDTGRYEIHGVMGPDEYHEKYEGAEEGGFRNNAYTNVMVVWCIERALKALELVHPGRKKDLLALLDISDEELALWQYIIEKMTLHFHGDGIISQFDGYEELEEFPWEEYREKYGDIQRLDRILKSEGTSPDKYMVAKQPDVTMMFYVLGNKEVERIIKQLGYPFADDTIEKNIHYYLERTSHGSTLSRMVYSSLLDRIDTKQSWDLFNGALRSDYVDIQGGTTAEGIHLGSMAGTVGIVHDRYVGITTSDDGISIKPNLPERFRRISLSIKYRGRWIAITVTHERFWVGLETQAKHGLVFESNGVDYKVDPGEAVEVDL
ncbi:glycoside hydrolase family 65 protein [Gemmatimonadota bacterium]